MKRLLVGVVALLLAWLSAFAMAEIKHRSRRPGSSAEVTTPHTQGDGSAEGRNWAEVKVRMKEGLASNPGINTFVTTDADREEMMACWVEKMTKAIPGGPVAYAKMDRALGQQMMGAMVSECGQEFAKRVLYADAWTPKVAAVYAAAGAQKDGEEWREFWGCLASNAQHELPSPAAFVALMNKQESEKTQSEHGVVSRLVKRCSAKAPSGQRSAN